MWLFIVLVVLFALALGGAGLGTRFGSMRWSPAAIILVVAGVLYLTGHLQIGLH